MNDVLIGVLLSLVTAIAFGSYTSFNKVSSVVESQINPVIFNLYFMAGALIVCVIVTIAAIASGFSIGFSYLGLISGLLLTMSGFCSFVSVPRIGVAYTWAIAATTGCITAFIEGIIIGSQIVHWWATIVALVTLMASAATIVLIKNISACLFSTAAEESDFKEATETGVSLSTVNVNDVLESTPLRGADGAAAGTAKGETVTVLQNASGVESLSGGNVDNIKNTTSASSAGRGQLVIGVLFSIIAGLFLASIPLPSLFVPVNASGLCYFFSLGVGCLLVIPFTLVALILDGMMQSNNQSEAKFDGLGHVFNESNFTNDDLNCLSLCCLRCGVGIKYLLCQSSDSLWKIRSCLLPGLLSGIVWNGGNVAGILSLNYINYIFLNALVAISTPVAALYGVFLWRELTKPHEIVILFLATFALIGANILLAYGLYGDFV